MVRGCILWVCPRAQKADALLATLKALPVRYELVHEIEAASEILRHKRFHALIGTLGSQNGDDRMEGLITLLKEREEKTPVIIVADGMDTKRAERFHALGVFDVMVMPADRHAFAGAVRRALLRSGLMFPEEAFRSAPTQPFQHYPFLVGTSEAMQAVLRGIAKAAESDANVCIFGETGSGKELVARAIHYSSHRAKRPMIVFDCTAIPEGLMESEMFGHVKGSFTSAVADRDGVFQLANGGSLLFDEIGELSPPLQAKLLRVIQTREFRKVGGREPIAVDVRIISATHRNLAEMAGTGTFREDLYYRLDVLAIRVPPLRERKEDIPLLVDHMIKKFNNRNQKQIHGVHPKTMGALLRSHWPGNVRQLENVLERAAVMADEPMLTIENLDDIPGSERLQAHSLSGSDDVPWPLNLKDAEKILTLKALRTVDGDKPRAAALLGISLRTLYYKLKAIEEVGFSAAKRSAHDESELSSSNV